MKKSLLFGFAAALTLASCTTNDEVLDAAAQTPMEFSSFVNKGTKAPIDNSNLDNFSVFGYKYKKEGTASLIKVFDDVNVGKKGDTWSYITEGQSLRFWDKTCNYHFYAYAPTSIGVVISNPNTSGTATFTVTDFEVSNSNFTGHTDLLIAGREANSTEYGQVNFTFKHVLTKVSMTVEIVKALEDEAVVLNSAVLNNVYNKGTYTYNFSTQDSQDWAFKENEKVNFPMTISSPKPSIETTTSDLFRDLLMIPQEFDTNNKLTLDLSYSINGEEFTRNIDLSATNWAENMSILYTFTISADAINFSASVAEWNEYEGNTALGGDAETFPGATIKPLIPEGSGEI